MKEFFPDVRKFEMSNLKIFSNLNFRAKTKHFCPERQSYSRYQEKNMLFFFIKNCLSISVMTIKCLIPDKCKHESLHLRYGFSFHCEEYFCQRGYYTPPQCQQQKCAILLAEYPGQWIQSLLYYIKLKSNPEGLKVPSRKKLYLQIFYFQKSQDPKINQR